MKQPLPYWMTEGKITRRYPWRMWLAISAGALLVAALLWRG